jgi:hypothetical protein
MKTLFDFIVQVLTVLVVGFVCLVVGMIAVFFAFA